MTQEPYLYEDFALRRALSSNLVGFCRHLRIQGLVSGIGEQMDALRALESIPLREQESELPITPCNGCRVLLDLAFLSISFYPL